MLRGGKVDAVFGEQSYVCEEHIASFPSGVSLSKVYLGDKKQAERLEGALQCMKSSRGKKACDAHVCAAKLPLIALEGDDDGAAIAGVTAETAKELAAAGAGVVLLPQICGHEPFLRGITAPRNRRAGAEEKIFNDYKENIWQNQIKDFVIFVS